MALWRAARVAAKAKSKAALRSVASLMCAVVMLLASAFASTFVSVFASAPCFSAALAEGGNTGGTIGGNAVDGDTAYITDASGAMLAIPPRDADIKIASVYAVSVPFIVALGLQDSVVAINCKSRFWTDNVPELKRAGSVGRGVVDLEALAALEPSVLLHRSNDVKTAEAVSALGIDVLQIQAESMADVAQTLRIMGRYFGREARAEEVVAYMDEKFAMIDELVEAIPPDKRPTALIMGGEYGRIAGEDMLQTWMLKKAGGMPVVQGIRNNRNWTQTGLEKLFELDPDYLFLTSSTPLDYSREEIMGDPVWSAMKCVVNNRVMQVPSRIDSWDLPGVVSVIGTMWMLNAMHPERFGDDALAREIDEYYSFMFGRTFDSGYLGYEP